jgi:hypothetical protein
MVAQKDTQTVEPIEEQKEQFDMPTGTHDMIIAPIIDMVKEDKAANINFETVPSYTTYLKGKQNTGALLKLYFKNYHIESMYDHVRHYHQGDQQFTDDQHRLVEEWKTVKHQAKNEDSSGHIRRIDEFSQLLNALYARTSGHQVQRSKKR